MLLGKYSRFVKRYDLTFNARHKGAARLNIVDSDKLPSVLKALHRAIQNNKASTATANGDEIELLQAVHDQKRNAIVLLFHRGSPDAADPMYRKKDKKSRVVTVRTATKAAGEVQSLSAHLVILTKPEAAGRYRSALEEVPGISLAAIEPIIAKALREYPYDYTDKRQQSAETYTTIKSSGIKSATLADSLKRGHLNFITLIRPADLGLIDAEGIFQPVDQRMKIRIDNTTIDNGFFAKMGDYISGAKDAGWEHFDVDVTFENERHRTIKVERDQAAQEVLFVKAEEVEVKKELPLCTTTIIEEMVGEMTGVMQRV
jgi:hypothetical protein